MKSERLQWERISGNSHKAEVIIGGCTILSFRLICQLKDKSYNVGINKVRQEEGFPSFEGAKDFCQRYADRLYETLAKTAEDKGGAV